jgi:ArsR family transcriptional regulator, arsenate/arsenite/antimonite-responsive transcriptional repressor
MKFMMCQQYILTFDAKPAGVPGTEQYEKFAKDLAQYTRAIGHPARIAVLIAVARKGEGPIREIIEIPELSKSTVLQHLRELKRAGLIQGKLYGSKTEYTIDFEKFSEFDKNFRDFLARLRFPGA